MWLPHRSSHDTPRHAEGRWPSHIPTVRNVGGPPPRRGTGGSGAVGLRVDDRDAQLLAVGRGVGHLVALGLAVDRGTHGRLGGVDVERVALAEVLARAEEELLLVTAAEVDG